MSRFLRDHGDGLGATVTDLPTDVDGHNASDDQRRVKRDELRIAHGGLRTGSREEDHGAAGTPYSRYRNT